MHRNNFTLSFYFPYAWISREPYYQHNQVEYNRT